MLSFGVLRKKQRYGSLLFFLSLFILCYFDYIVGSRRANSDSYYFLYPYRRYLSDAFRDGIFPFWDPFSSIGVPTLDFMTGVGYPVAIVLALFRDYDAHSFLVEMLINSATCYFGMHFWLRRLLSENSCIVWAGAGAFAFSAPLMESVEQINTQVSMAYIPWIFLATEMIATQRSRKDAAIGCGILTIANVMTFTGGYAGITYVAYLFAFFYGLFRLAHVRAFWAPITCVLFSIINSLLLLAIPLSEVIRTYWGKFGALRGFSSVDAAYIGAQPFWSVLSFVFPNSGYLPNINIGLGQMYAGGSMFFLFLVGVVFARLRRIDWTILFLLVVCFGSCLGKESVI
jgi:hypothetical protein